MVDTFWVILLNLTLISVRLSVILSVILINRSKLQLSIENQKFCCWDFPFEHFLWKLKRELKRDLKRAQENLLSSANIWHLLALSVNCARAELSARQSVEVPKFAIAAWCRPPAVDFFFEWILSNECCSVNIVYLAVYILLHIFSRAH